MWTAAVATAVVFGAAAIHLAPLFPGGDEPHYLVITQSLLKDGDLRIENNHQREDYLEYFEGTLRPDYLRRGVDGQIYSIHAPGLPALALPAFAVAGHRGVVAFLILVAALASALVWRSAHLMTGNPGAAWFGWAASCCRARVVPRDCRVSGNDRRGAGSWRGRDRGRAGTARRKGRSPVVVALVAARIGSRVPAVAAHAVRHRRGRAWCGAAGRLIGRSGATSRLALLFAVPAVSAVAWIGFFKILYGRFDPSAPYGRYMQTRLAHVPVALPALLFDQQFGLIPNAPVYAVAILGLFFMVRARRRLAFELLALGSQLCCGGCRLPHVVGRLERAGALPGARLAGPRPAGSRVLGRFTIDRQAGWRVTLGLTLLVSSTDTLVQRGGLIFNARDTVSRLYEWLIPTVDLNRAMPSFFRSTLASPLWSAAIWVGVAAACVVGLAAAIRRLRSDSVAARGAAVILTVALVVSVTAALTWRSRRRARWRRPCRRWRC